MTDKLDNSAPFNDDQGTRIAGNAGGTGKSTGAGAEAAEGIHGQPKGREGMRDESDNSSVTDRDAGEGEGRRGSEPLGDSDQHRSGYGGDAGRPKDASNGR